MAKTTDNGGYGTGKGFAPGKGRVSGGAPVQAAEPTVPAAPPRNFDDEVATPIADAIFDPRRHIAVIGPSGTGKTTWAANADEVLILLSEPQAKGRVAEANPGARVIEINHMNDLRNASAWLTSRVFPGGKARTDGWAPKFIVMDSITDMARYKNEELQAAADRSSGKGHGEGDFGFKGWRLYQDAVMHMVRMFRSLPVTLIGLFLDESSPPSDGQPGVRRAQLGMKSVSTKVVSMFDLCFWAHVARDPTSGSPVFALRTVGGHANGYLLEHGKGHPALPNQLDMSEWPPARVIAEVAQYQRDMIDQYNNRSAPTDVEPTTTPEKKETTPNE